MKVLQINSVCGYGSTGRIVQDLYNTLKENGHECIVAYGRGKAPDNVQTIKIGNKLDTYFQVFLTRLFDKHGFGSRRATRKLIKQIEKYNPDVIHLHNIHGYYINIEILFNYLNNCNKKIIWTLHDCWPFTGHCAYFDYVQCERWKENCKSCPQKRNYPNSIMLDNSKRNYNRKRELFNQLKNLTLVTPSEWLANKVKKSFLKNNDIIVIPNGIDLNIFKPTKNNIRETYNLEEKKIILGVASKWEKRKGLDTFIELSQKLDDSYKIVLIGVGEKDRKKIPKNILTIKRTNNAKELAEFYTSAYIFVNPTMEDNFPTTNLESLACGTPVITFNTGGSPESINETCGLVVEKGNIADLINAINGFNREQYVGCLKQSKNYDKEKQYKKYIELYEKVIK